MSSGPPDEPYTRSRTPPPSNLQLPPVTHAPGFASLSFVGENLLRFYDFPVTLTPSIWQAVARYWPKGIHEDQRYKNDDLYQVMFSGKPFSLDEEESYLQSKIFVRELLRVLYAYGWVFTAAANLNDAKDTLVFRYQEQVERYDWAAVVFSHTNGIYFMDCEQCPSISG
ncbi:unnamed protein product [Periconia digitata]|uniref:Uncharacterized protein n=1 Tax=Periconia digitata TaxID=1303443 RepID=A0A9W4UDK5_9PLEO|nr:unnamed protein product [Periconia digitata]